MEKMEHKKVYMLGGLYINFVEDNMLEMFGFDSNDMTTNISAAICECVCLCVCMCSALF